MSLYPSLEDMKVDHLQRAQYEAPVSNNVNYPILTEMPEQLPYPVHNSLPYPISPSAPLYPSLDDYMGLELTPAVLEANMPEYTPNAIATRQNLAMSTATSVGGLIAPLSGTDSRLQRAHVTNGVGELSLCKAQNNKLGIKVQAINNGIFIALVQQDSPAAAAGLRFGDQILQVQGKNVAGLSADQVHDLIKKGPDSGLNIVVRDRPLERTVTLHKDSMGKIGFSFKNGKIISLVVDSSAARNGLLTEHQMLEVNGQNVVGLKDKDIMKIIEGVGSVVVVTVIPSFIYEHITKKIPTSIFSTMDHTVW